MIIQGGNNPLTIVFDSTISDLPTLVVTMWHDSLQGPVKTWTRDNMTISVDTAICPLTEEETRQLPPGFVVIAAKGLDANDETVFWDEARVDILNRRDKAIRLTQTGG